MLRSSACIQKQDPSSMYFCCQQSVVYLTRLSCSIPMPSYIVPVNVGLNMLIEDCVVTMSFFLRLYCIAQTMYA